MRLDGTISARCQKIRNAVHRADVLRVPVAALFVADFADAVLGRHTVGIAVQGVGNNKIEMLPRGLVQRAVSDNGPCAIFEQVVAGE